MQKVLQLIKFSLLALLLATFTLSKAHSATSINSQALSSVFSPSNQGSTDFTYFPKWTRVIPSLELDSMLVKADCNSGNAYLCNIDKVKKAIETAGGKGLKGQLETVNSAVNNLPYVLDPNNFGMDDYWQTPQEFLSRNGDCEDFAIMKYAALKKLGVPVSDMRILVLNDENLRLLHAVLVVNVEGTTYLLDNQVNRVVQASAIHHYQPIYSINEEGWWRHQIVNSSL